MDTRNTSRTNGSPEESEMAPSWLVTFLKHQEEMQQRREAEMQQRREEDQRLFQQSFMQMFANMGRQDNGENSAANRSTSTNPRASRPSTLDVDVTYSKFRSWRNAWNDYAMLQQLDKQPIEVQKADFRCCLSEEMRIHLKCAIDIEDENDLSVAEIMDKIQEYLRQKRNVALDRVAFEERRQQNGESFDEFYVSVRRLADESDLCDKCYDQRLTTKIMSGIRDTNVRKELLAITPFPDLKTVINICRSEESALKDSLKDSLSESLSLR